MEYNFYKKTNINNKNEKAVYQIIFSAHDWCIAH